MVYFDYNKLVGTGSVFNNSLYKLLGILQTTGNLGDIKVVSTVGQLSSGHNSLNATGKLFVNSS